MRKAGLQEHLLGSGRLATSQERRQEELGDWQERLGDLEEELVGREEELVDLDEELDPGPSRLKLRHCCNFFILRD